MLDLIFLFFDGCVPCPLQHGGQQKSLCLKFSIIFGVENDSK